jgi:ABC-type transport system involved in multi-copper enzyme maturation permease subunit
MQFDNRLFSRSRVSMSRRQVSRVYLFHIPSVLLCCCWFWSIRMLFSTVFLFAL